MRHLLSVFDQKRWKTYLGILSGTNKENSLRAYLIKGTSASFLIKATHTGLLILSAFVFARLMGAEGYGTYAFVMSWVAVLLIPALLGIDTLLVRQVAIYHEQSDWASLKGIMRFAGRTVLATSFILAICAGIVAQIGANRADPTYLATFWIAFALLPLFATIRIHLSVMRGLSAVVQAHIPELVIQPGTLVLLSLVTYYLFNTAITPLIAVIFAVVSGIIALAISNWWLAQLIPSESKSTTARLQTRYWLRSSLPLVLIASMAVINNKTDILMIGSILGYHPAGVYAIASQISALVTFALIAVNTALSPTIARLHSRGEKERLQAVVTKSTRFMLACGAPMALMLLGFGYWILLLFGSEFTGGLAPLRILVIGQIVNVAAGSVGWLLIMTGHERGAAIAITVSALANIILNAALIPIWGTMGAAIATAISIALSNVLLAYFVFIHLGIYPPFLPRKLLLRPRNRS